MSTPNGTSAWSSLHYRRSLASRVTVLTTLAVRKHGVAAVLRTLARAERAPGSIAAI